MLSKKTIAAAGAALAMVATTSPAPAQEKASKHTLGSAANVWRVELRNLERFLVTSLGDKDGTSELHRVTISINGPDGQYHSVAEINPFLSVNGGSRSRKNSINVRMGQRVFLERLEPGKTDTYNLWIHAKERPQVGFGITLLNFEIKVASRELNCFRDRVCGRGGTGVITYYVSLPVPTVKSNRCENANSYKITAINGNQMRLDPKASGRSRVNVRSTSRGGNTTGTGQRLILAMQSGVICIASTSR